jgi:hypothetical protein
MSRAGMLSRKHLLLMASVAAITLLSFLIFKATASDNSYHQITRCYVPTIESEKARKLVIGLHITDCNNIDLRSGAFNAEFYYWLRYSVDAGDDKTIERLDFVNGRLDLQEEQERKRIGDEIYVVFKVKGTFRFDPNLRTYPFDSQKLPIKIEHSVYDRDATVFVDDIRSYARGGHPKESCLCEALRIPEYKVTTVSRNISDVVYNTDFGDYSAPTADSTYSRFAVSLTIERIYWPYLFKILLPLWVIWLMGYLMFLLPPKEIQGAIAISMSALLSCIAFEVTISQSLPPVGYLITCDKFFIVAYVLLSMNLAASLLAYRLHESDRQSAALALYGACRRMFPILFFLTFAFIALDGFFTL